MPKDNLLKEAIADAKTVRDTAIANAKLSLEEAFKPHLSSMLASRLRNEVEDYEDGSKIDESGDLKSSEIGSGGVNVDDPGPKEPSDSAHGKHNTENKGLEVKAIGDGDPQKAPLKEAGLPTGDSIEDIDLDAELDMGGEEGGDPTLGTEPSGLGKGPGGDGIADTPDELDLEAIIRELELDVQDDDAALGTEPAAEPTLTPQHESFKDAQAGKYVDGAFDGGTPMKEKIRETKKVTETVAGKSGDGIFHDGQAHKAVEGVPGGKKVTPGQQVTGTKAETMTEEIDLDEILREVEAEEMEESANSEKIASENVDLKRNLREHREVIQFLREKLQEVNMLNAKLLYTNKLFKGFNLGESQKLHIVESFDRAKTLREVKLIFTTLAESLTGKLSTKKLGKSLTESLASKPAGDTKPRSEAGKSATILAEGTDMVARLQKLAGIKTN